MKIKVLGCGNAFSLMNYNQSFLLTETFEGKTRKLAIDCGIKFPDAIAFAGIPVSEIDDIYISHLHSDHVGGLEFLALNRYDWGSKVRPKLASDFSPPFKAPVLYCEEHVMERLWTHSLRGGLETIEGTVATLRTFFQVKPVTVNEGFMWQGWHVDIIQQIHIMSGKSFALSFGLMFKKDRHKTIYFTTDAQHCSPSQLEVFYREADVIFQDCEIDCLISGVHANYIQLAGYPEANSKILPPDIRAKMKLAHYHDFYALKKKRVIKGSPYPFYSAPESQQEYMGFVDFDWDEQAQKDGFDEFVRVGDEYDTSKPGGMDPNKILGEMPRYAEDQAEWLRQNSDQIDRIKEREERLKNTVEITKIYRQPK